MRANLLKIVALITCVTLMSGCVEREVVVAPQVKPSSLTPQPILLFNRTKEGRKLFVLNDEFPYCDAATGAVIVVPKYYVTDFASVPWYGQSMVDPQGPTARAAILHDWLYTIGERGHRKDADDLFYRAMRHFGVSEFEANLAYQAVRLGGEGGYGLKGDWSFMDPAHQDHPLPPPMTKPQRGVVTSLPGCRGFEAMIRSGWKAYAPPPAPPPKPKGLDLHIKIGY